MRRGGKLPLVRDGQRRRGRGHVRDGAQRDQLAGRGFHVNLIQGVRAGLEARFDFEDHPVLVELRVNDRHLPLAERVIERVVHGLRQHVEAGRLVAVHLHGELQTVGLLVAGGVGEFGQRAQTVEQLVGPGTQFGGVGVLQNVLVLRAADAAVDLEVLHGLHVEGNALEVARFPAAAAR